MREKRKKAGAGSLDHMRDHKTETLCDFNGQFLVARRQMFDLIEQKFPMAKKAK